MAVHAPTKPLLHNVDGPMKRLFNVDEFYRMAEVGIFHEDDRLELIAGEIFEAGTGVKRLFNVDEYYEMAAAGILTADERVELIEGEIVQMMTIGNRHAGCVKRLNRLFVLGLGDRAVVGVQDPVHLDELNQPQPDLSLLRPRSDFYSSGHPTPGDVLLLVEVADSSLPYDRATKIPLYARYGIRELWLVDLNAEIVEIYRRPAAEGYQDVQHLRRGDSVEPEALAEFALAVEAILG